MKLATAPQVKPSWRRPRPKAYNPKPTDPGRPVRYTESGQRLGADGTWTQPDARVRTGTIWSAGPRGTLWVIPAEQDDGPRCCVNVTKAPPGAPAAWQTTPHWSVSWQAKTLRRVENLRRARRVFSTGHTWDEITWHTDPACPFVVAAGGPGDAEMWPWTIIRGLIDQTRSGGLCRRCVWLDEPAEESPETSPRDEETTV